MESLIKINDHFETLSSRGLGAEARETLLSKARASDIKIILDFNFLNMSPSFADEFIGIVAADLGLVDFKKKIKLVNLTDSSKSIIKHVVSRRVERSRLENQAR